MNNNEQLGVIFSDIAKILEILADNVFKIRAYRKAASAITALDKDIRIYYQEGTLLEITGIGKDLEKKIQEFFEKGEISYLENLRKEVPDEVVTLLSIKGLGPKMLGTIFNKFNLRDVDHLEEILSTNEISDIRGMSTKKIDEIKQGIKLIKEYRGKILLSSAIIASYKIFYDLKNVKGIKEVSLSGSIRRKREAVDKIDILVGTDKPNQIQKEVLNLPFVQKVLSSEENRICILDNNQIPIVINIVKYDLYGAALQNYTGSESHNGRINELAGKIGVKIDESGHFYNDHMLIGKSETEIYNKLGLQYIQPELREDNGEIEAAIKYKIPSLIDYGSIKGDLHMHSNWSDGKATIEEMAISSKNLGYKYIAITDHSPSSRIANGLSIERLIEKRNELRRIDKKLNVIKIFMGAEVDIKPNGELDYPDEVLKLLDFAIASVHSNFKMEKYLMTKRIISALKNPYIHALGHPTGRLIGQREPYLLDIDEVIKAAKKYNKLLEINASYLRLDLKDEHVRKCVESGIKMIISTDSHHPDHLQRMEDGIATARRGWAKPKDIINTESLSGLNKWLENFRKSQNN